MIQSSRLTFPGSFGTPLDARYDHPVGPVASYAPFTWEAVEGPGIAYELKIYHEAKRDTPIHKLS